MRPNIQFYLLLQISSLIFSTPVTWEIVSFRMHCSHQILEHQMKSIKFLLFSRRIVNYLTVILVLVSFHASHPYNITGCTKVLNSLIFVFQPILCVFQIFPKLKIATCALLRCFLNIFCVTTLLCRSHAQIYKLFNVVMGCHWSIAFFLPSAIACFSSSLYLVLFWQSV